MSHRPMYDKYDLASTLYGIRELYQAITEQQGIEYEKRSLRNAIRILAHNMPRKPKKDGDIYRCPRCGHYVDNYFCADCGQRIYWDRWLRPFDGKRKDPEYRYHDMEYINIQECREIEWYIRVHGLQWVLSKLVMADRHNVQPQTKDIRRWADEVCYRPGDELTEHDEYYEEVMKSRRQGEVLSKHLQIILGNRSNPYFPSTDDKNIGKKKKARENAK